MYKIQKKYPLIIGLITSLLFIPFLLKAQKNLNEQVEVKRDYKPVLGESLKIRKSPQFGDDKNQSIKQDYPVKDPDVKPDTGINSIKPYIAQHQDKTNILPFYIRAAGGNLNAVLAEIYYNSLPNPQGNFGINIKHLSLSGKLENERFSNDQINFFGRKNDGDHYFSGDLGLNLKSNPFYGYDNSLYHYNASQVQQQFRKFNLGAEFGKIIDTAQGIQYHARLSGYYLGDSYSENENHIDLSGNLGFNQEKFSFNLLLRNVRYAVCPSQL